MGVGWPAGALEAGTLEGRLTPEFYQLLARRRMARSYLDQPVPRETLERLLEAARRTPSAGHAQGVRFGVITDPSHRRVLATSLGESRYLRKGFPPWLSRAPVHLLVGVSQAAYEERYREEDKTTSPDEWPIPYPVLDGGHALMTLYLAAESEGLACGYLGPHRAWPVLKHVPWPDDWRFLGLVTVGYRDREHERPSRSHQRGWRPLSTVVHWWDQEVASEL